MPEVDEFKFAGILSRAVAGMVDSAMAGCVYKLSIPFTLWAFQHRYFLPCILQITAWTLVNLWFVVHFGGTPGKMIMRVQIVDEEGRFLSWGRALRRWAFPFGLFFAVSSLLVEQQVLSTYPASAVPRSSADLGPLMFAFGRPYVMFMMAFSFAGVVDAGIILFNRKKRAIHDFFARSYVINRKMDERPGQSISIPTDFYLKFYLKNSLMALGTGFVLGFLTGLIFAAIPLFLGIFLGSLISFIAYQFTAIAYFFGKRRGMFEHCYRIEIVEQSIRQTIATHLGFFVLFRYGLDSLNRIHVFQMAVCEKLSRIESVANDPTKMADLYLKMASLAGKEENVTSEIQLLKKAFEFIPNDFLVNYHLASVYAKSKITAKAIDHYRLAMESPHFNSSPLKRLVLQKLEAIHPSVALQKTVESGNNG